LLHPPLNPLPSREGKGKRYRLRVSNPSLPRRGFKGRFWVRFPKPLLLPTLAKDRPGGLKKQNIIKHKLNQKWKQPKKNFINKF